MLGRFPRHLVQPDLKHEFTVDHGTKSRHTAKAALKAVGLPKHF